VRCLAHRLAQIDQVVARHHQVSVITQFDGLIFTYRDGPSQDEIPEIPVRSVASEGCLPAQDPGWES